MSFTKSCFIKKNTPELRNKLMLLGYRQSDTGYKDTDGILVTTMSEFCSNDRKGEPLFAQTKEGCVRGVFHCGTNEELFLAIAALRDDSDNMQWFTNGMYWGIFRDFSDSENGFIDGGYTYLPNDSNKENWYKATITELIEHFKAEE